MHIRIFGKENCGKCDSAKDKMFKMGYHYSFVDIEKAIKDVPDCWRDTGLVEAMAIYQFKTDLPIIRVVNKDLDDEPHYYHYSDAMKYLHKKHKAEKGVEKLKADLRNDVARV